MWKQIPNAKDFQKEGSSCISHPFLLPSNWQPLHISESGSKLKEIDKQQSIKRFWKEHCKSSWPVSWPGLAGEPCCYRFGIFGFTLRTVRLHVPVNGGFVQAAFFHSCPQDFLTELVALYLQTIIAQQSWPILQIRIEVCTNWQTWKYLEAAAEWGAS